MKLFGRNTGSNTNEEFPLHKAAFENNIKEVERLLKSSSGADNAIDKRDMHGYTALHLATILGHQEIVHLLLEHGASVRVPTKDGWDAQTEAISFGNREIISTVLRAKKLETRKSLKARKSYLAKVLSDLDDFYLEIKWDFESWIPLLSKILPSDRCKIYKHGCQLRVDSTLIDFNDFSWQRGDISFIFSPQFESQTMALMDNKKRVFQRISSSKISEKELEKEVDDLMSVDLISLESSIKTISFSRTMSGWFFKQEKMEEVGEFSAETYAVEGLHIITKKRREHLSDDDVKHNKDLLRNLLYSMSDKSTQNSAAYEPRKSLPPPPKSNLTWDEYKRSPSAPKLGRPRVEKKNYKEFRPIIAMSEEFPLSVERFVEVLEVAVPLKHIEKLHEFCQVRLPPGFPVKLEIPLFATISAKVTFENFEWRTSFPPDFFSIPPDYKEKRQRFAI